MAHHKMKAFMLQYPHDLLLTEGGHNVWVQAQLDPTVAKAKPCWILHLRVGASVHLHQQIPIKRVGSDEIDNAFA